MNSGMTLFFCLLLLLLLLIKNRQFTDEHILKVFFFFVVHFELFRSSPFLFRIICLKSKSTAGGSSYLMKKI